MDKEYDNTNQGELFINKDKDDEHPKWPDYEGEIDVEGKKFWISAWDKTSKKGLSYLSIALKPKEAKQSEKRQPSGDRPF